MSDHEDTRPLPGPAAPRSTALQLRESYMLQTELGRGGGEEPTDEGFSLQDLLRLLTKYKWVLLGTSLLGLGIAAVDGLTRVPMYRASATLQIDQTTARIIQFNRDVDPYQDTDGLTLQTQIELLRSRALAERVIDELDLDPSRGRVGGPAVPVLGAASTPAVGAKAADASEADSSPGGVSGFIHDVIAGWRRVGQPALKDRAVLSREALVGGFMGSVQVAQVPSSRLVRVTVINPNPEYAARVANGMAKTFIAVSMERRNSSSGYAETFLQEQINATKTKLGESEKALNEYARANSILMLDDKTNALSQTFSGTTAALAQAERDRQKAEAVYNEVLRNPESAQAALESKTIQAYKEQKAKLEGEYLSNLSTFKPEFPKMQQLKAQIAEVDARIKAETGIIVTSLKANYEAAKRQEEQVRGNMAQTRKEVLVSQDRSVQLNLLKREVDTNRELYDGLLQRLKEVGVSSKVTANPISIVDSATPPLFPFEPNLRQIAIVGLLGGLLVGLAWAFVREHMDDSIKHADEIEAQFGLPLLGMIPQLGRKFLGKAGIPALLTVEDPRGMLAEAYRSMRTALQFSTAEGAPHQLMVTSTSQGEGKSTTALALAINFAQLGKRVLLVDGDMRNPTLHKALGLSNDRGLSNYLSGEGTREQLIHETSVAGLALLTAGPTPPSPADLLMGSRLLRLLEKSREMGYNQVVVDAPPVLGIADAIVLGNQIPNIVFVVRASETRKSNIRHALRRLRLAGLLPLGIALTRVSSQHTASTAYDSYYGYGYGDVTPIEKAPAAAERVEPELGATR